MFDEIEFNIPREESSIIKVIGVGGGGSNAVNQMFKMGVKGVDFIVCNTDAQALNYSPVSTKITLGKTLTEGRGAGNNPERGRQAAIESLSEIEAILDNNTKMVFITAGMGGGTGTGAAPVIAEAAHERDILTIGIVSIPFLIEGETRINQAKEGIEKMREFVDALLVINNEKLYDIYNNLKFSEAFLKADEVLATATKGIAEIITIPGYINVDFEDVKTVMKNSGVAIIGSSRAKGENRDLEAIKSALEWPLLNDNDIRGAKNILLNIISSTGEHELTMAEFGRITGYFKEVVGKDTNVIWGTGFDNSMGEEISVTIIATGFATYEHMYENKQQKNDNIQTITISLGDDPDEVISNNIPEDIQDNNHVISSNGVPIELEIEFPQNLEEDEAIPDINKNNFTHVKDITDLNNSDYLDFLEGQPAIERKKNNTNI
jgi:cell division protein FtsZ